MILALSSCTASNTYQDGKWGISDLEELPLPPDSSESVITRTNAPWQQVLIFKNTSSGQSIQDFYHRYFTEHGWLNLLDLLQLPHPNRTYADIETYQQMDKSGSSPWRNVLTNDFLSGDRVRISLTHWPDPAGIPLYGSAKNITTKNEYFEDNGVKYHTSYTTEAKGDAVKAYYKSTMETFGWEYERETATTLQYSYVQGRSMVVDLVELITIKPDTAGQVFVDLQAGGVDYTIQFWHEYLSSPLTPTIMPKNP
jgi:hypothetical protein